MKSVIFRMTARLLLPLLMLQSLFLFIRGHNEPGGGFVGGLVAASAWVLYALAYSPADARRAMHFDPRAFLAVGLLLALSSGVLGLLSGSAFLTGLWVDLTLPGMNPVAVGTPVIFDAGVYLVVLGITLTIILALAEEH